MMGKDSLSNNRELMMGNERWRNSFSMVPFSLSVIYFPLSFLLLLSIFFSCTDMVPTKEVRLIDSLNGKAYAYRYRNLDSSYKYADQAYRKISLYKSGKAEAKYSDAVRVRNKRQIILVFVLL